ncbi:MAG: transglutaminase domain-containing protein [Spirochaetales bacterium]|nr:transglutaminase domain-containing protein [Spirochaetales bacterium]
MIKNPNLALIVPFFCVLLAACTTAGTGSFVFEGENQMQNPLEYYKSHGHFSDPGRFGKELANMPDGLPELCKTVQGLLLHVYWTSHYGYSPNEERKLETCLRTVNQMLLRISEMDSRPLMEKRSAAKKCISTCRDYALVLVSMLRSKGIPARARCGFARYFTPGLNEDHWVCEYWNGEQQRWILVDAQLDATQRKVLNIGFDPCDVPRDMFIMAGRAWKMCREGKADPDTFGIFQLKGLCFIMGNVLRDAASLNKAELLPWDFWGPMLTDEKDLKKADYKLLDTIAAYTENEKIAYGEIRELYESEAQLKVPQKIKTLLNGEIVDADLEMDS